MTLQQYNEHGNSKLKFKCTKGEEIRYTLADSIEHCNSKFSGCKCEEITEEEFLSNYPFTK